MIFPFESLDGSSRELGLVAGLAIGFAFGFVLERAGFGRATKLAAQFYLRDMTVFKVMFSAIVTAMLGLVLFDAANLVDLRSVSESIASWTYIAPMLIGGIVLGAGFILSGYCPGTSVVAASSGNIDGMVTVGGVIAGSWLYSELLRIPAIAAFHVSGERGALFLYDIVPVSPSVIAAAIAAAALAAFAGAEKVEAMVARGARIQMPRPSRIALAAIAAGAVLSLGTIRLSGAAADESASAPRRLGVAAFAHRLVDAPWTMRILDLRSAEAFAAARIPGSEPAAAADVAGIAAVDRRAIVLVTADGSLRGIAGASENTEVLDGGFAAWEAFALHPPAAGGSPEEIAFRASLHASLTGAAAAAPPPPPTTAPVQRARKKGGGCSA
ncbi:MAG TPA: YeeE/YedE thiosulfate transporter family protein [Thermoanaerobaculia bacterium]|nr:YeeE/YedE thiosulfate transporter family protein [Thermoanaerobaculia bacterium]